MGHFGDVLSIPSITLSDKKFRQVFDRVHLRRVRRGVNCNFPCVGLMWNYDDKNDKVKPRATLYQDSFFEESIDTTLLVQSKPVHQSPPAPVPPPPSPAVPQPIPPQVPSASPRQISAAPSTARKRSSVDLGTEQSNHCIKRIKSSSSSLS